MTHALGCWLDIYTNGIPSSNYYGMDYCISRIATLVGNANTKNITAYFKWLIGWTSPTIITASSHVTITGLSNTVVIYTPCSDQIIICEYVDVSAQQTSSYYHVDNGYGLRVYSVSKRNLSGNNIKN